MSFSGRVALLLALGIFTAGCSPSDGPADHADTGSPAAADASPGSVAASAAATGFMPLTADELKVAKTASPGSCNVEALGNTVFGSAPLDVKDKSTTVGGWFLSAVSRKSGVPAQLRVVNMAGTEGWQLPIRSWVARPDVISTMHAVDSGNVGFTQAVDFKSLPAGQYHLLVTFKNAGQAYACDKGSIIKISID
ncbi:hypothetical protein ACFPPA_14755 [Rhodanobacter ginsengisoli]|uniref:Proteinase inhibitor I42 chagasin domain-containing protein n=1 Tax=Rhodanobacter ginsengisoli TaxID=418646 RepID=A0ABW0QTS2_9GAMM